MTLFLQHLAVFGVVVINSWSLETRERKRERKHLNGSQNFGLDCSPKSGPVLVCSCMCIGVAHNGMLHVHIAC